MARIVFGCLLTVIGLTYQGVRILRTGQTNPFPDERPGLPLGTARRLQYACIHLFPAAGIAAILATALAKNGASGLGQWLARNLDVIFFASCFSIIGLLQFARPEMMIRRSLRDHPELADQKSVVLIMRLLGIAFVGIAIVMIEGR